jgi:hypothetical protein
VVADLRHHVPDDTYRFEPASDFTGRNIYRASLLRLENLEKVHADALRAGTLDDVIAFAKGRALERLRAYDLAAASYRRAAERDGPLRIDALGGAALCDALAESTAFDPAEGNAFDPAEATAFDQAEEAAAPGVEGEEREGAPGDPETGEIDPPGAGDDADPSSTDGASQGDPMKGFELRQVLLETMLPDTAGTHYEYVVKEEIERVDVERAGHMADIRHLEPDGDLRALSALQQVVTKHRESKRANAHLLALADLYAELTVEYVQANPPESLSFDPPQFEELVEAAARLYEAIANQDGATEKLEAARKLEAFLAFTLKVDRDRFSP